MKNITIIKGFMMCAGTLIGTVTPAWAATGRDDNSDLFVWIFLGFCASIVVAQLIPAMMMFMGFAKGTKKRIPETVPAKLEQTTP